MACWPTCRSRGDQAPIRAASRPMNLRNVGLPQRRGLIPASTGNVASPGLGCLFAKFFHAADASRLGAEVRQTPAAATSCGPELRRATPCHTRTSCNENRVLHGFAQRLGSATIFPSAVLPIRRRMAMVALHIRPAAHFAGWQSHREEG